MAEQKTSQQPEQDLSQQTRVRREKLAALQAEGMIPSRSPGLPGTTPPHRSRRTLTPWRASL